VIGGIKGSLHLDFMAERTEIFPCHGVSIEHACLCTGLYREIADGEPGIHREGTDPLSDEFEGMVGSAVHAEPCDIGKGKVFCFCSAAEIS
jgi:hypothetical protein